MQHGELPDGWDKNLPTFPANTKGLATRESGTQVINALAKNVPWLIGRSADLQTSNKTNLKFEGAGDFQPGSYGGRNLHFGVREHAMGAALNGMALSKVRPFGATFFNFTDYMRPSMRLAALMEIPVIYVFTHDSIGLSEAAPLTSRLSNWLRYAPCRIWYCSDPLTLTKIVEAWKVVMQLQKTRRPWC